MTEEEKLPFLSRWSRRKIDAKETAPPAVVSAPAPALPADGADQPESPAGAAAPAGAAPAAAPLPSIESLQGVASEYKAFMQPGVDETLKRAALKKLFNDPHFGFASMDKLDTYIDDYSIEDPIPEAMLRMLNQSKSLFLFDEKEQKDGETPTADIAATATTAEVPAELASPEAADLSSLPDAADAQTAVAAEATPQRKKSEPPASA